MSAVEKSVVDTVQEYRSIPVDQISVAANIRRTFDQGKLEELAASLKEYGVLQPLVVRPLEGKYGVIYELVAGERRLRAAKMAGLLDVPCRVVQLDAKQVAEIQLLENLQREDLNPLEEARALSDLIWEHGYTQEQLAAKIGKSQPWVASRTRLLDLPEAVRDGITRGIVNASAAEAMLPFAKAAPILTEFLGEMEKHPIPVAQIAYQIGWRVRRDCRPVFVRGYYGDKEPKFELGPCQNCSKVVRLSDCSHPEPWCTDVACWEAKQEDARKHAVENELAKAAEAGDAGVIDLNKLDGRQYHQFRYGENTPPECRGCEHLKRGKTYGDPCDTCMNPKCYNRKQREKAKTEKLAKEAAFDRLLTESMAKVREKGYIDDLAFFPRRLLVFLAGLLMAEIHLPYEDEGFKAKKWLADKIGWPGDKDFDGTHLAGTGFGDLAECLHVLDNTTLASLIFEWFVTARGWDARYQCLQPLQYLTGEWADVSKPAPGHGTDEAGGSGGPEVAAPECGGDCATCTDVCSERAEDDEEGGGLEPTLPPAEEMPAAEPEPVLEIDRQVPPIVYGYKIRYSKSDEAIRWFVHQDETGWCCCYGDGKVPRGKLSILPRETRGGAQEALDRWAASQHGAVVSVEQEADPGRS